MIRVQERFLSSLIILRNVGKRVSYGEAFDIIEKKCFMKVDGELVPNPGVFVSPEGIGYDTQVMYMSDTLGCNMFGPLTSMAQELIK